MVSSSSSFFSSFTLIDHISGPAIALDFNRQRKDVFLVGTDDGKIYKGSVNDPGMIDMTFHAHDFTIYAVQWRYFDTFHPDIMLCTSFFSLQSISFEYLCFVFS